MAFADESSEDVFSSGGGQPAFDVKKLLETLRKFYWIFALTAALGLGLSYLYLKTTKPLYSSTAEIKIERRSTTQSVSMTGGAMAYEGATTPEDLKTIEQSFISPMLMRRVIAKLDLTTVDNFVGSGRPAAGVSEGELVGYLMGNSKVALVPDTRLIQISFQSWDPAQAELVANAIVEEGIGYDREQRIEAVSVNVKYLQSEAEKQESNLKKAEEVLNDYTEKLGIVSIDGESNIVEVQLRDLNSRHTAIKSERLKLESDYEQIEACLNEPEKLLDIESIRKVPAVERLYARAGELRGQLVKLAQRYRPENPLMIQTQTELREVETTLKQEILQAPKSIEVALAAVKMNEESIARAEEKQEQKVIEVKKLAIDYKVYQRQIDAYKLAYEATLKRLNEETSQARSQPVLLQMVDPAGPGFQISVKPARVLITGLVGGLMLGAGLIVLIMQLDSSIKSVEDAESAFRLSVLAAVPEYAPPSQEEEAAEPNFLKRWIDAGLPTLRRGIEAARTRGRSEEILALPDLAHSPVINDKYSHAAEAFRTLRASIQMMETNARSNLVLVTSPMPGEGKSFCALNLAVAMANSGQLTLLVDAQLRKPVIEERVFGTKDHRGLADYLQGDVAFSSIIRATPVPNLDVVTAGTPYSHPAEILSRQRFQEFLAEAQPNYDRVIFDSASITPVSDTLSFARFFHVVCLVLRASRTPRRTVNRAVELLSRAGAKPFGLVMNFVPLKYEPVHDPADLPRLLAAEQQGSLDFPKTCSSCGKVYENFEDFIKNTLAPAGGGGEQADPGRGIRVTRICECGSPVVVSSEFRRDTSESGLRRRYLFGELHDRLVEAGIPREEARAKLLLTLKVWRNEIFTENALDESEAGVHRRNLFAEILELLVKSGLPREEARAKLLQTIQIWRDAP